MEAQAHDNPTPPIERDAEHLARLAADPALTLTAWMARNIAGLPVSKIAKGLDVSASALDRVFKEQDARFQSLAGLPLAVAMAELKRLAA